MDFREVMEKRSSCRRFKADPVPPETLRELVRLAGLAPSPANAQPWRFIAVSNKEMLQTMAAVVREKTEVVFPTPRSETGRQAFERLMWFSTFFAEAPVVIFAALAPFRGVADEAVEGHAHPTHEEINAMRRHPDLQCLGAAIEHLLLAATGMGLAGCWLSAPPGGPAGNGEDPRPGAAVAPGLPRRPRPPGPAAQHGESAQAHRRNLRTDPLNAPSKPLLTPRQVLTKCVSPFGAHPAGAWASSLLGAWTTSGDHK
ncbi:MAG: nitroreductase family protein [Acidobacteriota bacterium]|nr:nitroreductase family protein [Acidobacteriota bacterium]